MYKEHIDKIIKHGEWVVPRGEATKELRNQIFVVPFGRKLIRPRLNPLIGEVEGLGVVAGVSVKEQLEIVAPKTYAQGYFDYHTDYGARQPDLVKMLVERLTSDIYTRRAIINIASNYDEPIDLPCTTSVQAIFRNKRLHFTVCMRSSDVYRGLPVNVDMWNYLANSVISELLRKLAPEGKNLITSLGNLTIFAASSHIYDSDIRIYKEQKGIYGERSYRFPYFTKEKAFLWLKERDWTTAHL